MQCVWVVNEGWALVGAPVLGGRSSPTKCLSMELWCCSVAEMSLLPEQWVLCVCLRVVLWWLCSRSCKVGVLGAAAAVRAKKDCSERLSCKTCCSLHGCDSVWEDTVMYSLKKGFKAGFKRKQALLKKGTATNTSLSPLCSSSNCSQRPQACMGGCLPCAWYAGRPSNYLIKTWLFMHLIW